MFVFLILPTSIFLLLLIFMLFGSILQTFRVCLMFLFVKACENDFFRLFFFSLLRFSKPFPLFCFSLAFGCEQFLFAFKKIAAATVSIRCAAFLPPSSFYMYRAFFTQHQDRICLFLSYRKEEDDDKDER